jgi:hypothetical protein
MRHQIADQRIITLAPAFRRQDVARAVPAKGIARAHGAHLMPRPAQGLGKRKAKPFVIQKDQPVLPVGLGQIGGVKPGRHRLPDRLPAPVRHIVDAGGQRLRFNRAGGAG